MEPINIEAKNIRGGSAHPAVENTVDQCPICKVSIRPMSLSNVITLNEAQVWRIHQCPNTDCQWPFIVEYRRSGVTRLLEVSYRIEQSLPHFPARIEFPESVTTISQDFAYIYNQAYHAESIGLDKICGSAYRKALEFLIKDYCISLNPDSDAKVKALPLAACIKDFVRNDNVKICASRAAWLGNDETHYERLWETKDIKDLKTLIDLTVNHIDSECRTKEYLEAMPAKPKKS